MKNYNIKENQLFNNVDCYYDEENNKIDVYTSIGWTAETKEDYQRKEKIIEEFSYNDNLIEAFAWCDISGFDYWVTKMEEDNYVSIDVILKKLPEEYTQEEIKNISNLIVIWEDALFTKLL